MTWKYAASSEKNLVSTYDKVKITLGSAKGSVLGDIWLLRRSS